MSNFRNRDKKQGEAAPPPPNERVSTGNFKLNIDENLLATGPIDMPQDNKRNQTSFETVPLSRKIYYTEKEKKQEKKEHKKRNKLKARKNKRVFSLMWILMVLLVSFTFASYLITGSNDFFAIGRPEGNVEVVVPEGEITEKSLSEILVKARVINKAEFFELYCKFTADMDYFRAGVFKLRTNMDYEDIINTLQGSEAREEVTVTFPEGLTALEVADLLEENEVCGRKEFLEALNSDKFDRYEDIAEINNTNGRYFKLEGYLFPDTYRFYKKDSVESVIGKFLSNFEAKISDVSDIRKAVEESDMTLDEIVILASIIQREAADTKDMYLVSAVLNNRLEWGANYNVFTLGCDATMFYPYKTRDDIPAGTDSSTYGNYDTYEISGLPSGAICSPSEDAIRAALFPSEDGSAYLYFCHSSDGKAYYATNEYQHNENLYAAGLL